MLKKFFNYNKNDSLVRDSFVLFLATMIANAAGYLYHFYMGRALGPEDYSILGVILTILYIVNVPVQVIQMTITKFVVQLKTEKKETLIKTLFRRGIRKMFLYGIISFATFLILALPLARFLHIPVRELFIFSPLILFALLLPITRGVLQGLQRFTTLGLNMILEGCSKLFIGILLVAIGFHIGGAVSGIVLSFALAFAAALYVLRTYYPKTESGPIPAQSIYAYATPVFITLLCLTLYYSLDLFLVKHYFSELDAGYYAATSLIGKIIFFGTFSLGMVMFPKVAEMHSLQQENKHLLTKSLLLMFAGAIVLILIYFFFPTWIILPLFGKAYLAISNYIGIFGIAMTFFSFSYLLALYNLSVQRTGFIGILILFNILELTLITLFHTTLLHVLYIVAGIMTLLFLSLFIYTYKPHEQKTQHHHTGI